MTRVHRLLVPPLLLAAAVCPRNGVASPSNERTLAKPTRSRPATETTATDETSGTAGSGLVLLIADRADDPFLERIKAELVAIGFATVVRRNDISLERAAREVNAVAAIRVLPSRQGVEVWMADRTSGRSLLRQVIVDENPSGPNQSVIALQTAELLRTSLLEPPARGPDSRGPDSRGPDSRGPDSPSTASPTPAGSPPSDSEPPSARPRQPQLEPPPPPAPDPATAPPSAGLQAALGALYSPGGGGAALQLWLSLQRSFSKNVALAIDVSAPLLDASLSSPEGRTRIGTYMAGAAFLLQARSASGQLFVNGGIGVGAVRISVNGEANPPLQSRSDGVTSVTAYVRSDLGVELAPWLRLGARATAGAAPQRVDITVAGNDGGSWGRIYAGAFFLAEVPWR